MDEMELYDDCKKEDMELLEFYCENRVPYLMARKGLSFDEAYAKAMKEGKKLLKR